LGVLLSAGLMTGCVESLPHSALPELGKEKRPLLSTDQQRAAIGNVSARKDAQKTEALKQIEASR
jgi:hypothetical protein